MQPFAHLAGLKGALAPPKAFDFLTAFASFSRSALQSTSSSGSIKHCAHLTFFLAVQEG
jgi:hypothetical protein